MPNPSSQSSTPARAAAPCLGQALLRGGLLHAGLLLGGLLLGGGCESSFPANAMDFDFGDPAV